MTSHDMNDSHARRASLLAALSVPFLALVSACSSAFDRAPRSYGPVQPVPGPAPGSLVVYTDPLEWSDDAFTYRRQRPYDIYDESGRYLRRVRNHVGVTDETPTIVPLLPGTYRLSVPTEELGRVQVRVVIEAGSRTTVTASSDELGKQ